MKEEKDSTLDLNWAKCIRLATVLLTSAGEKIAVILSSLDNTDQIFWAPKEAEATKTFSN